METKATNHYYLEESYLIKFKADSFNGDHFIHHLNAIRLEMRSLLGEEEAITFIKPMFESYVNIFLDMVKKESLQHFICHHRDGLSKLGFMISMGEQVHYRFKDDDKQLLIDELDNIGNYIRLFTFPEAKGQRGEYLEHLRHDALHATNRCYTWLVNKC